MRQVNNLLWSGILGVVLLITLITASASVAHAGELFVRQGLFVVIDDQGRELTSWDLIGATFQLHDGAEVHIDAVAPSAEQPDILLHEMSYLDVDGAWRSFCMLDAKGRRAAVPIPGAWSDEDGYATPNRKAYYLSCTSGAQAKCLFWGYAPWKHTPVGAPLAPYYTACVHMVRADYDGRGAAHTRNGTPLDYWDHVSIETSDTKDDPAFAFEAGWGLHGAVCVARTRWPSLLPRAILMQSAPRLDGPCDEASAAARQALLFTRVRVDQH